MADALNLSVRIGVDAKAGVEALANLKRTLAQNEAALKAAREEASRLAAAGIAHRRGCAAACA